MTTKELLKTYIEKVLTDPKYIAKMKADEMAYSNGTKISPDQIFGRPSERYQREADERVAQAQAESLGIDYDIQDNYDSVYLADAFSGLEDF